MRSATVGFDATQVNGWCWCFLFFGSSSEARLTGLGGPGGGGRESRQTTRGPRWVFRGTRQEASANYARRPAPTITTTTTSTTSTTTTATTATTATTTSAPPQSSTKTAFLGQHQHGHTTSQPITALRWRPLLPPLPAQRVYLRIFAYICIRTICQGPFGHPHLQPPLAPAHFFLPTCPRSHPCRIKQCTHAKMPSLFTTHKVKCTNAA